MEALLSSEDSGPLPLETVLKLWLASGVTRYEQNLYTLQKLVAWGTPLQYEPQLAWPEPSYLEDDWKLHRIARICRVKPCVIVYYLRKISGYEHSN